jgi:hypothetical protein
MIAWFCAFGHNMAVGACGGRKLFTLAESKEGTRYSFEVILPATYFLQLVPTS